MWTLDAADIRELPALGQKLIQRYCSGLGFGVAASRASFRNARIRIDK